MKLPLQISFRNCPQSPSVITAIEEKANQLDHYFPRIMGCRVVVETPHRHQHKGKLYRVLIDMTLPGDEIVVGRNPAQHAPHKDVFVAIRDSFKAARRQLQDVVRRRRGDVKFEREGAIHGQIVRLFAEGYGFLKSEDGREIYFHKNSVINNGFDRLEVGNEVRFNEEAGDEGPQATTVHPLGNEGKHRFW